MAQQLTIKQIAALAGVSAGTVDRVLHNRGKVSQEALAAVQKVLDGQSYKYNLHTSAVAFKKTKKSLKILVSIPSSEKGEYWDLIREGIEEGFSEYGDFDIESQFVLFNQFDSLSCRDAFDSIAEAKCSAVVIGTTFVDETRSLCERLNKRHVPYVFVDGGIEETTPVATYKVNQVSCGRLLARLMDGLTPQGKELVLMVPRRIGTQMSNNSAIRKAAFKEYFPENGKPRVIHEAQFSTAGHQAVVSELKSFLAEHPNVGGIAVAISLSYIISDALRDAGITGLVVGGFDVTDGNARCVREGTLDFLINQHPERQGFYAVESILHYLIYGTPDSTLPELLPIDIVFKENLNP